MVEPLPSPSNLAQSLRLNNWSRIRQLLGRTLRPDRCRLCLCPNANFAICANCRENLPWLPDSKNYRRLFGTSIKCAFSYEFPINALIIQAKYHRDVGASILLGSLLASCVNLNGPMPDFLVPIPMPWPRLLWRGHNHTVPMAQTLSAMLGIPLQTQLLVRKGWQRPQKGLTRPQRHLNLAHAFFVDGDIRDRYVALVDDVSTTGATLETAAKILLAGGARRVDAWVVASAQRIL